MKLDISSRKDISTILSDFYEKMLSDEKMFPFFEQMVLNNEIEKHLEITTDFWHDILFDTTLYKNNTMKKHTDKHVFVTFEEEHFTRWMSYLFRVIEDRFIGLTATKMKTKATSIAMVMKVKMNIYKK